MQVAVSAQVDLARIRASALAIAATTGVPLIAVLKANAYGLGAAPIARALAPLREVEGFYTLTLAEALAANLPATGKPTLALEPYPSANVDDYLTTNVRPSVWTPEVAATLKRAHPVLSIDTGMQRFAAPPTQVDAILKAGDLHEAMTHATRLEHVTLLQQATHHHPHLKLHAAGTALLNEPRAYLNATRPGVSLYRDALTLTTPLYQVRDSASPAGYTGFITPRHGLILLGYQHGLRTGPCLVNHRPSRLLEVGMQTSFVQLDPTDKVGDPVTLIDPTLPADAISPDWRCGPHEVLLRLSAVAPITYVD